MTTINPSRVNENARIDRPAMQSTETKASIKTSELMAYIGAVVAVIVTAIVVGQGDNGGTDPFGALDAIRYISYLTIGYMVARGLAKSGSPVRNSDHDAR